MIFVDINPTAFTVGPISVGWYSIMLALAVVTLVLWAVHTIGRDARFPPDTVLNAALIGIPSGIVFSRLLHVLDQWHYYSQHPQNIIGGSGLTIWGAVLGVALSIWTYSRFSKNFSFGQFTDLLAPGVILAQAVGRVGCTILGDDYGFPTSLPWGFVYTSPNSPANVAVGLVATHPVVLYEIIFNLIVFGILLKLRGKFQPDGSLFLVYLALYSVWRLGSDFLRQGTPFLFGLHQAQFISVIVLIIAVSLLALRTRRLRVEAKVAAA